RKVISVPIPNPKVGETKKQYMHRCMHEVLTGYRNKDQALAICLGKWRNFENQQQTKLKKFSTVPAYERDWRLVILELDEIPESLKELKTAYRTVIKRIHPDHGGNANKTA